MHGANLDPAAYGIADSGSLTNAKASIRQEISLPRKAANWLYINPFKMIGEYSYTLSVLVRFEGGGFGGANSFGRVSLL